MVTFSSQFHLIAAYETESKEAFREIISFTITAPPHVNEKGKMKTLRDV